MEVNKELFVSNMCDSLKDMILSQISCKEEVQGKDIIDTLFHLVQDIHEDYEHVDYNC